MGRTWGYWTRGKLDILRRYLDAFSTASKRSSELIYIDVFAGVPENTDRLSGETIDGSARIALSVSDPSFSRVRLFELVPNAKELERSLRAEFPGRDIRVYGGDCNEQVPIALADLARWNWAPTFAFVDPNGHEAQWRTIEALAGFKRADKPKVELFVLFASPQFVRLLTVHEEPSEKNIEAITNLFGTDSWINIYQARRSGNLNPAQARDEYLHLMRWRLENDLGYKWTHPIEVHNEQGVPIYYMIFATDHEAGNRIMQNVYARAAEEFPAMREQARRMRKRIEDEEAGRQTLFEESFDGPIKSGERFYEHEPPIRPWFLDNHQDEKPS